MKYVAPVRDVEVFQEVCVPVESTALCLQASALHRDDSPTAVVVLQHRQELLDESLQRKTVQARESDSSTAPSF